MPSLIAVIYLYPVRIFLILLTLSFTLSPQAQSLKKGWKLDQTLPIEKSRAYLDQLNSLYVLKSGEVKKFDPEGKELSRYSNKLIGNDVQIDVTNPMKVLLYAPNQMTLITLDSRVGEMNAPINFFQKGYEQITLVATSHSNCMWLYDPINFKLIRLNTNLEVERTSLVLSQLLRKELFPTDLVEINNKVYLTDPRHGVFVFDIFANYIKTIPIKGIEWLVISDDRLFYQEGDKIKAHHLIDSSLETLEITIEGRPQISVNRNRVAVTYEDRINIYRALP